MKKTSITFLLLAIIVLSGIGFIINFQNQQTVNTEFLRIHIRADSNEEKDQQVKYKVKEKIVEYLTPFLVNATSKEKAMGIITDNLENISNVATKTLKENGFSYTAKAKLKKEEFPTRTYGDLTLEKGIYDALIVELGSGSGNNWWCVVYPPLCFVGSGTSYTYRSKILDVIEQFKQNFKGEL